MSEDPESSPGQGPPNDDDAASAAETTLFQSDEGVPLVPIRNEPTPIPHAIQPVLLVDPPTPADHDPPTLPVLRTRAVGATAPRSFGKYRLVARLGRGGTSDVYLALSTGLVGFRKLLVVKQLRPHLAEEPEYLQMFLDEARLAARLNHPNVVQTTDVDQAHGRYYIAMEYLDGQPLSYVIHRLAERRRRVPLPIALKTISDMLGGLQHAHELNDYNGAPLRVVHRDVTPGNIFLTYEGQIKLVDFGVAKAAGRALQTSTGVIKGKVGYMSPEQLLCRPVDCRADLFAAGVVLFELVSGRRLGEGLSPPELLRQVARSGLSLRTALPNAPRELDRICSRALAASPEDRYASAAEMREQLDRYIETSRCMMSTRDIATFMMEEFGAERAAIRSLVEQQANLPAAGPELAMDVPTAPPPPAPFTSASPEATSVSIRPPTRVAARRSLAMVLAAAVGVGTVTLALIPVSQTDGPDTARRLDIDSVKPHLAGVPAAASPTTPERFQLHIEVVPRSAKVYLDGEPLALNPYRAEFTTDDRMHHLFVAAEGYEPHSERIPFDRGRSVHVELRRVAVAGGVGAEPAAGSSPSLKLRPRVREIDVEDPWR